MNYIYFSLNENGEIVNIDGKESIHDSKKIENIINSLVLNKIMLLGKKTEGYIDFYNSFFHVSQKVCRPIGEFESWDEMFSVHINAEYEI